MSEIPDKRRRVDLDLFVLALIDGGISTPYQLQKIAGISQGASIPVLQRLLEAKFVRHGKLGLRGKVDYQITAGGRKALKSGWRNLVDIGPSGDLDADLRVALLAVRGGDHRLAIELLHQSAEKRHQSLTLSRRTDEDSVKTPSLAELYKLLRTVAARTLAKAESTATLAMAEELRRRLSALGTRKKVKL